MHIQEIKIKKSSSETWSSLLLTLNYFTLYSSVPIVEFEKVIVFWVYRWSSACFSYFWSNIKICYFIVLFMKIIKNNSNIYFISTLWEISNGIFDTIFFTLKSHKQRQWFVDVLQNMYFEKTFEFSQENTELFDELFWSIFSLIWTEYGEIPYSDRIRKIQTRKNYVFGHFSSSVTNTGVEAYFQLKFLIVYWSFKLLMWHSYTCISSFQTTVETIRTPSNTDI